MNRSRNFDPDYPRDGNYGPSRNYSRKGGYGKGRGRSSRGKRNGCSKGTTQAGELKLYGWRIHRGQMVTFNAFPVREGKNLTGTSPTTGKRWERWVMWVKEGEFSKEVPFSAMYYPDSDKLVCKELGLMAHPNGKGGRTKKGKFVKGYFGPYNF